MYNAFYPILVQFIKKIPLVANTFSSRLTNSLYPAI